MIQLKLVKVFTAVFVILVLVGAAFLYFAKADPTAAPEIADATDNTKQDEEKVLEILSIAGEPVEVDAPQPVTGTAIKASDGAHVAYSLQDE
jgi:hypothetical protein